MFDISTINKRYFDIKLTAEDDKNQEHSMELQVLPPRVKDLKSLLALQKASESDVMDRLAEDVLHLLNRNKTGCKVPPEYIDALDFDELQAILEAYFAWVSREKREKN